MRIAITNAVLSNTGDAAICASIIDSIKSALGNDTEVIVFDSNARVTSSLYPQWKILQQLTVSPPRASGRVRHELQKVRSLLTRRVRLPHHVLERFIRASPFAWTRFAKSFAALTSCNVVISSGGTYLVDHYNFETRATELEIAKNHGSRVILWTQSLGPFKASRSKADIARIEAVADSVYLRDSRSQRAWMEINANDVPNSVVPDAVFGLNVDVRASGHNHQLREPQKALLSVRNWTRGVDTETLSVSQYSGMMREGAIDLLEKGWEVEALSTCQGVPSYAADDSRVAARTFSGLDVVINRDFHGPQDLIRELSEASLVITTRMHLAILALVSRTPVIAIAYEFKTLELFKSVGLEDFVIRIEDADEEWLLERIDRLQDSPMQGRLPDDVLHRLFLTARRPADELSRSLPAELLPHKRP